MKWLTNTYDPRLPEAKEHFTKNKAFPTYEDFLNWLSDKQIGAPKASKRYSSHFLQQVNMVGIYSLD